MEWKLAAFGPGVARFYVKLWRYGEAAKGEPAEVVKIEWFASEADMQQRLRELFS